MWWKAGYAKSRTIAYWRLLWKAGNTELCGLEREAWRETVDMRVRSKLGRRSRSLGPRGRAGTPSINSGEVVYGIRFGEAVVGGERTSAMAALSGCRVVSGMRNVWWSSVEVRLGRRMTRFKWSHVDSRVESRSQQRGLCQYEADALSECLYAVGTDVAECDAGYGPGFVSRGGCWVRLGGWRRWAAICCGAGVQ
jgi:hypothetical protein